MPPSPWTRAIVHLDMDAFYASVEQRDNPALRGKPVIVGGHPTRGVVIAASYEVRPFGVRSAMSMVEARRRAPQALVVPPRPEAYAEASAQVFALMAEVTPLIEPLSLDEAFLDVTGSQRLFGTPSEIAARLRKQIAGQLDLPASAGIADVKMAAKIASDLGKPNGQKEIPPGTTRAFMAPLPISRLWGVGAKTEKDLHGLGIRSIGALAALDPKWLERKLPGMHGLWQLACGLDPREVEPDRDAKSIGAEDTFNEDIGEAEALYPHIHAQALRVGARLRAAGQKARVVQLKLKDSHFVSSTRRLSLANPTDDGQELYRRALELLGRAPLPGAIRLTGVSGQELGGANASGQLGLFAPKPAPHERLNTTIDRIAKKFGDAAITTADLHDRPKRNPRR